MTISEFLDRKLARRFETYDFDGDGRIDPGDLLAAIHGFHFDESPASTGTSLLGPL